MRNLKKRQETIRWVSPSSSVGTLGSVTPSWSGTPHSIKGFVQPMSSNHFRAEYGERADRMRVIILPNGDYEIGDGVWLYGELTTDPPWIIISKGAWLDLSSITIEKR
jgi:hypothetical protein